MKKLQATFITGQCLRLRWSLGFETCIHDSLRQILHEIMNLAELRLNQPFTKILNKETYIKHLKLLGTSAF